MSRPERVLHPGRSALDRFGFELRNRRKEHGYSMGLLAGLVFVSSDLLQRIEVAERRPSRDLAEQLDKVLEAEGAILALWHELDDERRTRVADKCKCGSSRRAEETAEQQDRQQSNGAWHASRTIEFAEIDDMNRRELLRIMSLGGTLLALDPVHDEINWAQPDHFAAQTGGLDTQAMGEFAAMNAHLWRVFVLSRTKQVMFPLVRDQLDVLINSFERSHGPAMYRRLCEFISSMFQLAGEILFDGDRYTDAAHCYTLAASASREANAHDLWACALIRHAFIGVYDRQYGKFVPMLELAARIAGRGDNGLATRYWVSAVQAQAFAGLGDLEGCQRALDAAEGVRDLRGDIQNGGWLRFDGSRLAEERGTCYAHLGRLDLAEEGLMDALRQNLSVRRRGSVLADLAILGAQRRDIEPVITHSDAVFDLLLQTGSGVIARKLTGVRPYLAPLLNDARVRDLDHRITALAVGATTG